MSFDLPVVCIPGAWLSKVAYVSISGSAEGRGLAFANAQTQAAPRLLRLKTTITTSPERAAKPGPV